MKTEAVPMVSASGILGYGFPDRSLRSGLDGELHIIGVGGSSSDPGRYYLRAGQVFMAHLTIKRDMGLLLRGAIAGRIPMIIGSSGGAGDWRPRF